MPPPLLLGRIVVELNPAAGESARACLVVSLGNLELTVCVRRSHRLRLETKLRDDVGRHRDERTDDRSRRVFPTAVEKQLVAHDGTTDRSRARIDARFRLTALATIGGQLAAIVVLPQPKNGKALNDLRRNR